MYFDIWYDAESMRNARVMHNIYLKERHLRPRNTKLARQSLPLLSRTERDVFYITRVDDK